MFWNQMWKGAQWSVLCTKTSEVNLSIFIYKLFHGDLLSVIRTNTIFVLRIDKSSS